MVYQDSDGLSANAGHTMLLRSACSEVQCTAGGVCSTRHSHSRSTNTVSKSEVSGALEATHDHIFALRNLEVQNVTSVKLSRHTYSTVKALNLQQLTSQRKETVASGNLKYEKTYCQENYEQPALLETESCDQVVNADKKFSHTKQIQENRAFEKRKLASVNCAQMARTVYRRGVQSYSQVLPSGTRRTDEFMASPSFSGVFHSTSATHSASTHHMSANKELSGEGYSWFSSSRYLGNNGAGDTSASTVHRFRTSAQQNEGYSEDENESVSSKSAYSELDTSEGFFCYLLFLRKYLYFGLSKPTHYDFENLSRISTFGKKRAVLLILLPLLLWLLYGAVKQEDTLVHLTRPVIYPVKRLYGWIFSIIQMTSTDDSVILVTETKESKGILSSLWNIYSSFIASFTFKDYLFGTFSEKHADYSEASEETFEEFMTLVPSPPEDSHSEVFPAYISREEVKSLVHEILKEEVASQFVKVQEKDRASTSQEISKIQKEISSFQSEIRSLTDSIKALQASNENLKISLDVEKLNLRQSDDLSQIRRKLSDLENSFVAFNSFLDSAKNCCKNQTNLSAVESHLTSVLLSVAKEDGTQVDPKLKPFRDWLSSKFVNSKRVSEEMESLSSVVKSNSENTKALLMDLVKQHVERVRHELIVDTSKFAQSLKQTGVLSTSDVQRMIKDAILLYDADKTGQTDYALESGGGSVVNTRCSETYTDRSPKLTVLGLSLPTWFYSSSPRSAIQPEMHPGQCWAFKGSQGYLVIQLAAIIRPTAFVIEHIPKSLSPTGDITSAPKDFSVWGLSSEQDTVGKLLGRYTYDIDGEPLQYFPVQEDDGSFYQFVELKIHSNHGEISYTCLYRFRVHGSRY